MKSFYFNLVSFNATISDIALNICKILKVEKKMILFKGNVIDKRNYKVGSKIFKKNFGKNFKFSNFASEIKTLGKNMKKFNIKKNINTIRMKFYKKNLV